MCPASSGSVPVLAPDLGPAPSPDCYLTTAGGSECIYEIGVCETDDDCQSVLEAYFSGVGLESFVPDNAELECLQNGKCELFFPSTGCLTRLSLPVCTPAPSQTPGSRPGVAAAPASSLPPPAASGGVASAPSPLPSVVPAPPPPFASAARPHAPLFRGPFLLAVLALAACTFMPGA